MVYLSYATFLKPFSTKVFENYLLQIPATMQKKIVRFRRWEDSHNALMGKILLKEMATRYFKKPDILHQIRYSDFQRPEVEGSLSFNISHSGNLVVCVMSEDYQLGIDVERLEEVDFTQYPDFMSDKEWNQIQLAKDPNHEFLKFWTQKEAAIKADGRGLSIPIKELEVQNATLTIDSKSWYMHEVNPAVGYICHIASNNKLTSEHLISNDYENLKCY